MAKETVGIGFRPVRLVHGPTDDYECWRGELPEGPHRGEVVLYVLDSRNPRVE